MKNWITQAEEDAAKMMSKIRKDRMSEQKDRPDREKVIDLLHWEELTFIGQGNAIFEGSLTQVSEDYIADRIIALFPDIKEAKREERERIRVNFLKLLTVDSKTQDARRKEFNQAIFINPQDKMSGGCQVFNGANLDMVMGKFDKALRGD